MAVWGVGLSLSREGEALSSGKWGPLEAGIVRTGFPRDPRTWLSPGLSPGCPESRHS